MRKFLIVILLLCCVPHLAFTGESNSSIFETKHFSIDIPNGWIQRDTDSYTYFYAQEYGKLDGGMLAMQETSFKPFDTKNLQEIYDSFVNGIKKGESFLGDLYSENITIDGHPAIFAEYKQQLGENEEVVCVLHYIIPKTGYAITLLYTNSTSNNDREEMLSLVQSLKYKFDKSPSSHAFGKKTVSVIGYDIIEQSGYNCLVVEYQWVHLENEPTAFQYSFSTEAYQDGIQCQSWIMVNGNSNTMTKVQKETFMTCYDVFILNNTSSPVTLYLDKIFDFGNQYPNAEYKFDIAK